MQSSAAFRHFLPLRFKYFQRPFLRHPQSMFLSPCDRPSFTPIKKNRLNYDCVYVNLYDFREEAGR